MMIQMALLLLVIIPRPSHAEGVCDSIEVNHFYDEQGRLVFDQLIFRVWCPIYEVNVCQDWYLLKRSRFDEGEEVRAKWKKDNPELHYVAKWVPEYTLYDNKILWWHGDKPTIVYYKTIYETWTQYDPELLDREILPKEKRIGIFFQPEIKK